MELPSFAAATLSIGVVITKRGALAEADGVMSRRSAFCVALTSDTSNGNGRVWATCRDSEDRIWITAVVLKEGCACPLVLVGESVTVDGVGTVPAGNTEKI